MTIVTIDLPAIEDGACAAGDGTGNNGRWRVPRMAVAAARVAVDEDLARRLIAAARAAATHSYQPYLTKFPVGCALVMRDDPSAEIFAASSCENGVLNAGICAERAAIHYAVARGWRKIGMIVVSTPRHAEHALDGRSPCGLCRQTIAEFADPRTLIILDAGGDLGDHRNNGGPLGDITTIDRLLPWGYVFKGG
jgi:cytidine deaminase